MKYWKYYAPGEECDLVFYYSDQDILNDWFDYWAGQMIKVEKVNNISYENCIEDFQAVHWAIEITKEEYDRVNGKQSS